MLWSKWPLEYHQHPGARNQPAFQLIQVTSFEYYAASDLVAIDLERDPDPSAKIVLVPSAQGNSAGRNENFQKYS